MSWMNSDRAGDDMHGSADWIKLPIPGDILSGRLPARRGSVYVAPTNSTTHIPIATLAFSGGNLAADFSNVALGFASKVTNLSRNSLYLSFTSAAARSAAGIDPSAASPCPSAARSSRSSTVRASSAPIKQQSALTQQKQNRLSVQALRRTQYYRH
jgi:hypothetical protein